MLGIGSEKDDHRIELGVVELVDGAGCYVQKSVPAFLHKFSDGAKTDDARPTRSNRSASSVLGRIAITINF